MQNGVHTHPYLLQVLTSSQTGLPPQGLSKNNQTAVKNHGLPSLGSPALFKAQPGTSWGTGHRNPAVQRPLVGDRVAPQAPAQQMKEALPRANFTPSYTMSPRGSSFLVNFTSWMTAAAMSLPVPSRQEGRRTRPSVPRSESIWVPVRSRCTEANRPCPTWVSQLLFCLSPWNAAHCLLSTLTAVSWGPGQASPGGPRVPATHGLQGLGLSSGGQDRHRASSHPEFPGTERKTKGRKVGAENATSTRSPEPSCPAKVPN